MDYQKLGIMVFIVVVALLLIQGPAWWRSRQSRGKALQGLREVLPGGADPKGRYLFYFWSPSCGMCRSTTPIIEQLKAERSDVVSINVVDHLAFAGEVGIMGTPAFVVVSLGAIEQMVFGGRSRRQIEALLTR